jgi:hypothetical protein
MATCCVCLDDLPLVAGAGECTTECGHRFHLRCILGLVSVNVGQGQLATGCPLCRQSIVTTYRASEKDRELLRLVTNSQWGRMRELLDEGAVHGASIEASDYPSGANEGMQALHFAIRDHAPIAVIREIYEARPMALFAACRGGLTPPDLLQEEAPNGASFTQQEYSEVKAYIGSLVGREASDA